MSSHKDLACLVIRLIGFTWAIGLISSLGWGLGYFGQPHILVRFMAISDAKELKKSTNIAMVWVILSPYGSYCSRSHRSCLHAAR